MRPLFRLERSFSIFVLVSSALSAKALKLVFISVNWLFWTASRFLLNNSIFLTKINATASKGFLSEGNFLVLAFFLDLNGWTDEICCFGIATFVEKAVALKESAVDFYEDNATKTFQLQEIHHVLTFYYHM